MIASRFGALFTYVKTNKSLINAFHFHQLILLDITLSILLKGTLPFSETPLLYCPKCKSSVSVVKNKCHNFTVSKFFCEVIVLSSMLLESFVSHSIAIRVPQFLCEVCTLSLQQIIYNKQHLCFMLFCMKDVPHNCIIIAHICRKQSQKTIKYSDIYGF